MIKGSEFMLWKIGVVVGVFGMVFICIKAMGFFDFFVVVIFVGFVRIIVIDYMILVSERLVYIFCKGFLIIIIKG